ncbi:MAG: 50S ribosomal protein L3 [Erysipelotrichaceae bacterium]|nr:50S ribosomal protein L3 [Erysipelotrichaceae bacterium]
MKGILGRKLGMTQVFTTDGVLIPVTVVEATPNVVLQKKTVENDGYEAVQLGFEDVKEHRANKPQKGQAAKANTAPKHFVREIRGSEMMNLEVGNEVKVDIFSAGDIVDVTGVSKGKGYSGTIVRNNATIGPKTHGGSKNARHIGSLATIGRNNGVINKGTMMAGQEGHYTTTNQNLEVIKVDAEKNYMLIKGNVPGPKKGLVIVKTTVKPVKKVAAKELLSTAKEVNND